VAGGDAVDLVLHRAGIGIDENTHLFPIIAVAIEDSYRSRHQRRSCYQDISSKSTGVQSRKGVAIPACAGDGRRRRRSIDKAKEAAP
jgi:hypothetical protein